MRRMVIPVAVDALNEELVPLLSSTADCASWTRGRLRGCMRRWELALALASTWVGALVVLRGHGVVLASF